MKFLSLSNLPFFNRRENGMKILYIFAALALIVTAAGILVFMLISKNNKTSDEDDSLRGFMVGDNAEYCYEDPSKLCDVVSRPEMKFSFRVPLGWQATHPNSATIFVQKEDLSKCQVTLTIGDNEKYVSASGWLEIINPYGKGDPSEASRVGSTLNVGFQKWPAALLVTNGLLSDIRKEVYLPVGNIVFIFRFSLPSFADENKNLILDPDYPVCNSGFEQILNNLDIRA